MKIGNKVGIVALAILGLVAGTAVTPLNRSTPLVAGALVGPWLTIPMLVFAGIKGSRWWLTLPLIIIWAWIWVIMRGV